MLKCWSYDAESRPTFCYCLSALKELRDKLVSSSVVMPAVYNFNYLGDTNLGKQFLKEQMVRLNYE